MGCTARVSRGPGVAQRLRGVAGLQEAVAALEVGGAVRAVDAGDQVPGQLGQVVVHQVVVVVEEQQAHEPARFVDDDASLGLQRGAVFVVGAHHRQRERRVGHQQRVLPGAEGAEAVDEPEQRRDEQPVRQPVAQGLALPFHALCGDLRQRGGPGLDDGVAWPQQEAAPGGLARRPHEAHEWAHTVPVGLRDVVALRVHAGQGQQLVAGGCSRCEVR